MLALFARKALVTATAFGALMISAAQASAITFTNVTFAGTPQLISGASFTTGATDIDFSLPNAVVGDFQPLRQGSVIITYEAMSDTPMVMDQMVLTVLGGLFGSGQIQFSEVIEDMVNPGIIGSSGVININNNNQLPWSQNIEFTRATTHIKVKKEFFLIAEPDTPALDLARISLVEQNLVVVPEPGTMAAVGLGLTALIARRRRK
jgi:hypothetical protein